MQRDNEFPEYTLGDEKEELTLYIKFASRRNNSPEQIRKWKERIIEIDRLIDIQCPTNSINNPSQALPSLTDACLPNEKELYETAIDALTKHVAILTDKNNQLKEQLESVKAKEKRKRVTAKKAKVFV